MSICAAISHPRYKTKWGSVADSEKAMTVFKNVYDEISSGMTHSEDEHEMGSEDEGFIQLRGTPMSSASSELTRYLHDPSTDLEMLNKFPVIREMFFKYNTQLPSSATVERMFNFAGILDHPKRGRILPSTFEKNIILKANSVFNK